MEENKNSSSNPIISGNNDTSEYTNVDSIIDFYKDKPIPDNDDEKIISSDRDEPNFISKLFQRFMKKSPSDKPSVSVSMNDDEEIHSGSYGMDRKSRAYSRYIVTALICVAIIGGAYYLSILLPSDAKVINKYTEPLRAEEKYVSLSNRYNSLTHEVSELEASNSEKKSKIDEVNNFDNTKASLRTEIKSKADELNSLNSQIAEKREKITSLDGEIASSSDITLNAGKYVIGTNIPAGKYYISGSGKFSAASSSNVSKYNISLGSTAHEVLLEKGDIIKIDSATKFTSAN